MNIYVINNMAPAGITIPSGGLVLYGSVSAPTGWSFDTTFDDCFVLGGTYNATLQGAATHTHTQPALNTDAGHSHSVSVATSGAPNNTGTGLSGYTTENYTNSTHTHTGTGSGASTTGSHSHTGGTTGTGTNLPPYIRLRWIIGGTEIPIGGIMMKSSSAGIPTGYQICNGTNGTPDMSDMFVYGGTGSNGGSSSHGHTSGNSGSGGAAHTHTNISITAGQVNGSNTARATGGSDSSSPTHTHSKTALTSASGGAAHEHTSNAIPSETILPPYITAYYIMRLT